MDMVTLLEEIMDVSPYSKASQKVICNVSQQSQLN